MGESKTVTVQQVAKRFNTSVRTIHHWLLQGKTLPGIDSYEKLNPDFRNSPYVIMANADFFSRKKLTIAKPEDEADYLQ
jgi:transcriptional regulator with XRE-family HTH domain